MCAHRSLNAALPADSYRGLVKKGRDSKPRALDFTQETVLT